MKYRRVWVGYGLGVGGINYELIITNYGRGEGQEELGIGNWVASGEG